MQNVTDPGVLDAAQKEVEGKSDAELLALRQAVDARIDAQKKEAARALAASVKKLIDESPHVDRHDAWREVKKLMREFTSRKRSKAES